jgi:hypothetical protein
MNRPSYTGTPQTINYGQNFTLPVSNPGNATTFKGNLGTLVSQRQSGADRYISLAAIMDFGFHTHALNLDNKYVGLVSSYNSATKELSITGRE